jgi:hypothetical protein
MVARHTPRMITYRVIERGPEKFVVEALNDDHGTWQRIDAFRTREESNARKVRLEQILRASRGELG